MSQWNVPLTLEKAPSNGKELLQARETEFLDLEQAGTEQM